jgi:GNAT superfamily N-acetyltransferase
MAKEQARALLNTMKPILDEDIAWFAYHNDEPIGFFIMLPEINQIIKHINNGRFGPIQRIKFAWLLRRGVCKKMYGLVFGVIPEFQRRGVEGYIIMAAAKHVQPMNKYVDMEMIWIGDFNPNMIHLMEIFSAQKYRTAIPYRKLFDETKPFKSAPIIL